MDHSSQIRTKCNFPIAATCFASTSAFFACFVQVFTPFTTSSMIASGLPMFISFATASRSARVMTTCFPVSIYHMGCADPHQAKCLLPTLVGSRYSDRVCVAGRPWDPLWGLSCAPHTALFHQYLLCCTEFVVPSCDQVHARWLQGNVQNGG